MRAALRLYNRLHNTWPEWHPAHLDRFRRALERVPEDDRDNLLEDFSTIHGELEAIRREMGGADAGN